MNVARAFSVACTVVAAGVALTAATRARSPVAGCKPETGKRILDTRDFRFTLLVGPVENMYMPRQVRANHLKHGEEMLRGSMTPTEMLLGNGPLRHVEVQICRRATHAVVTNAKPKIVVDDVTEGKVVTLPFSAMQGIGQGVADLHSGNNLPMPSRDRYVVTVTWKRERAIFRFVLPPTHR